MTTEARQWYALVTFWADTPTDDAEADDLADRLSDDIETRVELMDGVQAGSVRMADLDSLHADYDVAEYGAVKVVRRAQ